MKSVTITRTILGVSAVGLLFCLGVLNCGHCSPVPTPTPTADASNVVDTYDADEAKKKDIFWGITADCSLPVVAQQRSNVVEPVRKCLDANTSTCLVQLAKTAAKDTIVCVVQQLDMELHAAIAKGPSTDAVKTEAAAASKWIRTENVGIRN